jgi:hypothetical protein
MLFMSKVLGSGVSMLEISQRSARILIFLSQEPAEELKKTSVAAGKKDQVISNLYLSPLL